MAKDIKGLCPITIGEVFFQLISRSIVLQLWRSFQEHLSPINLEYQPLEVVKPLFRIRAFLNLHLNWVVMHVDVKNTFNKKIQAIILKKLCDAKGHVANIFNYVLLLCSLFFLLLAWVANGRVHHYSIIFRHEVGDPLGAPLFALAHYRALLKTIT
jgi:hypothetical protein